MKNSLFFLILICSAILSCSKQPKCNDAEVQKLVVETLKKEISKNVEILLKSDENITSDENFKSFQPLFKNRELYLNQIQDKLYSIRTTDLKKEIRKCDCEGEYNLVDKSTIDISEIENDWVGGDFDIVGFNPTIKYTAQITDDNDIYITIANYEDFEVIERNVFAKVLKDIRDKNGEIKNKNVKSTGKSTSNLDAEILDDIQNLGIGEIASKWINTYDRLPNNYKNTVITSNGSYKMDYGDLYGLNKGFSSGLCDGYDTESVLFNYIADEYGATGGKTKQQEINGYRAGMVYHYLRSKVLKCQD